MAGPKNLTETVGKLRATKNRPVGPDGAAKAGSRKSAPSRIPERRIAFDPFMIFAYTLIGASVLAQFFLIFWLELV